MRRRYLNSPRPMRLRLRAGGLALIATLLAVLATGVRPTHAAESPPTQKTLPPQSQALDGTFRGIDRGTYPPLLGSGGQPISGKIPLVFYNEAGYSNDLSGRVHVAVPEGLVYVTDVHPESYQFVVVLAGDSRNLAPGEHATLEFYTMCIDRPGARPQQGMAMHAVGLLPGTVTDTMIRYRDMPYESPELTQTREATINAINSSVQRFLQCSRTVSAGNVRAGRLDELCPT